MALKKNSSGRLQNYDPKTGRYAKANIIESNENLDYESIVFEKMISNDRLMHIMYGEYTKESNRHIKGGHSQTMIDAIPLLCEINIEYNNGVMVGNIKNSTNSRIAKVNNHTWFPKDWDERKIIDAIMYGLRKYNGKYNNRETFVFEYDGVTINIVFDNEKGISTVYPNKIQGGGVKYDYR